MHALKNGQGGGFANHAVALYDPSKRAICRLITGNRGAVTSVARVEDVVVSGRADQTLGVRSASTRRGCDGPVCWVWQGNGATILTHGGPDGCVKL